MYGNKQNKCLAAKEWVSTEGLSVMEVEHHMDVEMFLEGQARCEVDNPHHPIILHETFQHAVEQGWKESECMICAEATDMAFQSWTPRQTSPLSSW